MANETDLGSFWLPPKASTLASEVDGLFDEVLWLNVALFAVVVGGIVVLAWAFARRRDDQAASAQPRQSRFLQVVWSGGLLVAAICMFTQGTSVFMDRSVAPEGAYLVKASAKDWAWTFTHPNGSTETQALSVPANRPVKLVLTAEDRAYAFTVPEFRLNQQVVPGRIATAWFEARRTGDYQVPCTGPCADAAKEGATITILAPDPNYRGLKKGRPKDMPPAKWGEQLFAENGCGACHSLDGTKGVGPSMKGLYGKMETLKGGAQVKVDDAYLAESILKPNAKLVEGFAGAMPPFEGTIDEDGVKSLIAFIKAQK